MNNKLYKMDFHTRKVRNKNIFVLSLLSILIFITFIISMNTGYTKIAPMELFRILTGNGSSKENLIFFDFRLPRILISMLVGMGFALSGCIIQGVSKNPLADSGLLGINSGAGIMVVIFVVVSGTQSLFSIFTLPILAFIGAGITAFLIYILSYKKKEGIKPLRLILNGVAIQAAINAVMMLIVVVIDERKFEFVATWQAGSIWGSNWKLVLAALPWIIFFVLYIIRKGRVLDVLTLGDNIACGLGAQVDRERLKLLVSAVALAATAVSMSGSINFVGMIAPHLGRQIVGPSHKILLPTCALIGALLVSISDTIARGIVQPSEIPTGIVVAVIGAPYFLYLLIKNKK